MSTHNTLQTQMECPHCHQAVNAEIELRFGNTRSLDVYHLGDQYRWLERRSFQNGGRPMNGDLDGEGYTECPNCQRDFFVIVMIKGDVIRDVKPDPGKPGYIPENSPEPTPQPRFNVDDDGYRPERGRSKAREALVPRVEQVLAKILEGEKSIHSVEMIVALLDIGATHENRRHGLKACRYYYTAKRMANSRYLGGWGTAAHECLRDARYRFKIPEQEYEIEMSPVELLRAYLDE